MSKYISTVFNSRGRLSQSDYAFNSVKLSEPVVALKSKYKFLDFFF